MIVWRSVKYSKHKKHRRIHNLIGFLVNPCFEYFTFPVIRFDSNIAKDSNMLKSNLHMRNPGPFQTEILYTSLHFTLNFKRITWRPYKQTKYSNSICNFHMDNLFFIQMLYDFYEVFSNFNVISSSTLSKIAYLEVLHQ